MRHRQCALQPDARAVNVELLRAVSDRRQRVVARHDLRAGEVVSIGYQKFDPRWLSGLILALSALGPQHADASLGQVCGRRGSVSYFASERKALLELAPRT
jgi:hypothetical protein